MKAKTSSQKLSKSENLILSKIKSLTAIQGYGNVVIVIRAGSIESVQITQNYLLRDIKEEPAGAG